eukprot:m.107288 g.107288  ORF g.107288 m.107288 type:complete len:242 (+) comp10619_c1_seq3:288-1013(+)
MPVHGLAGVGGGGGYPTHPASSSALGGGSGQGYSGSSAGGGSGHGAHHHHGSGNGTTTGMASALYRPTPTTLQETYRHVSSGSWGSVLIIASAAVVEHGGWRISDPLCAIYIAVSILISVYPLLQSSAGILLNRVPASLPPHLFREALTRIQAVEGVTSCREVHFWCHAGSTIVGTLHVVVDKGVNDQRILSQVMALLRELGITEIAIQIEIDGGRITKGVGSRPSNAADHAAGLDEVVKL